jgi:hypothetical protein
MHTHTPEPYRAMKRREKKEKKGRRAFEREIHTIFVAYDEEKNEIYIYTV